jgi:hypothetical protein
MKLAPNVNKYAPKGLFGTKKEQPNMLNVPNNMMGRKGIGLTKCLFGNMKFDIITVGNLGFKT